GHGGGVSEPDDRPARVLIVDDSVVIRRLLADTLSESDFIEVVGKASNGKIGLQRIRQLAPEVVVLDVEMPEMDGLETLKEIAKLDKPPRVIMFSMLTETGADVTVKALALGASDYVTKPANVGGVAEGKQQVRDGMVPKVLALLPRHMRRAGRVPHHAPPPPPKVQAAPIERAISFATGRVDLVVIASSTGGPNALAQVIPKLPRDLPVPVLIVQHMPPMFTGFLAKRLNDLSPFDVAEATEGEPLRAGRVLIAPGGKHMSVARSATGHRISVHDGPPENSCRPAADVLFRSAAAMFGAHCLGVVLTGMGKDGFVGCEHIKNAGGQVVSQDEATSVVWGMPGWVSRMGVTDRVLPLPAMAGEMTRRIFRRRRREPLRKASA
ncbi:MAG: chemotaxis response regulator protein-glutamate methylesterase, partial [Sandaracinaceae bacterium]